MSKNTPVGNMEDQTQKSSGFFRIPSIWEVLRTIMVMFGIISGLGFGLPALINWWDMGPPKVSTTADQGQDAPKVFGGGAPGR